MVDSAPSENEYKEHFLGVKAVGAWGWKPHHVHVPNVMKYELSGHTGPVTGLLYLYIFTYYGW